MSCCTRFEGGLDFAELTSHGVQGVLKLLLVIESGVSEKL